MHSLFLNKHKNQFCILNTFLSVCKCVSQAQKKKDMRLVVVRSGEQHLLVRSSRRVTSINNKQRISTGERPFECTHYFQMHITPVLYIKYIIIGLRVCLTGTEEK